MFSEQMTHLATILYVGQKPALGSLVQVEAQVVDPERMPPADEFGHSPVVLGPFRRLAPLWLQPAPPKLVLTGCD